MIPGREQSETRSAHATAWALLPSYANETLTPDEAEEVRLHLSGCAACSAELERCRAISAFAKSDDPNAWSPSPAHFARVMANIDATEATAIVPETSSRARRDSTSWIAAIRAWIVGSPGPVQWALAVQGVLLIGGAVVLANMMSQSRYETMSASTPQAVSPRAQLRVVFRDELSLKELGDMLHAIGAQVVSGPSPTGVYDLALAVAPADTAAVDAALAALRGNPKVQLAERSVDGATK